MKNILNSINITINNRNFHVDFSNTSFLINVHRVGGGINFESMDMAVYTLSPNAFAVYMYILRHSTNCAWKYSLQRIEGKTNMSSNEVFSALIELLSAGYLTPIIPDDGSDSIKTFDLWESPDLREGSAA